MKEKLLTENKSQRMLTGVMVALFFALSVCTIFTGKYVPTEKGLTLWEPERTQKQDDGTRHIYFTADTDREDWRSLVFFTSHQWVEVFADGNQIYKLNYTGGIWGHTTGNVWNFVKLPEDTTQIEVCLTACYPKTVGSSNKFYVGTGNEIYATLLRQSMPVFIISMLTLMVGLFMVLYWAIIHKSSQIDDTLLYLGVFSIMLGLWSANETDVTALVITNRQASAFAAFAFLMVMPMAFIMFVKSFLEIEDIFERFGKCYRIGGDEFCCIIPKAKDFNVEHFIQKLYQDVEVFNNKNIIPTEVAIACGYAFFTAEDTDIEKVRERADEMMYQNKKKLKGRN